MTRRRGIDHSPATPAVGLPYYGWLGFLSGRFGWASRPRAIAAHPSLYPSARGLGARVWLAPSLACWTSGWVDLMLTRDPVARCQTSDYSLVRPRVHHRPASHPVPDRASAEGGGGWG
eukprot:4852518-Pleurochrysis_carterae.AAC.2